MESFESKARGAQVRISAEIFLRLFYHTHFICYATFRYHFIAFFAVNFYVRLKADYVTVIMC